jgi:type I restriction enzyme M protein
LRDDGMLYGDYVEQLTYFLFLKMDDEQQLVRPSFIWADLRWASLIGLDGDALEVHYRYILASLGIPRAGSRGRSNCGSMTCAPIRTLR